MNREELQKEIQSVRWFHSIDLGQGVVTPGQVIPATQTLPRIGLPADLTGKTVLDVGAWDGFFSFEAERRGAKRVLATDSKAWEGGTPYTNKRGFELARRTLGSKVEDHNIDVMDLSPEKVGTFDVVLFLGVLYHLRHPMLALEKVFSVTRDLLILETVTDLIWTRYPVMRFYPADELAGDASNWFGPNPAAVVGMLKAVGFRKVEIVSKRHHSLVRRIGRAIINRDMFKPFWPAMQNDRMGVHAWR
jgi:tRNA (mo5U34)-methyltransferase